MIRKLPPSSSTVDADEGRLADTIRNLWPYMWPSDRPDLKWRVVWAFIVLIVAKVVTVLVPYFYKWATDALTGDNTAPGWMPALLVVPVMLVLAYNVGRVMMVGLNNLRDAAFAVAEQIAAKSPTVIRAAKESLNGIDLWDVKRSYRFEQGFTFELNLSGVADEHRDAFVAKRETDVSQ